MCTLSVFGLSLLHTAFVFLPEAAESWERLAHGSSSIALGNTSGIALGFASSPSTE